MITRKGLVMNLNTLKKPSLRGPRYRKARRRLRRQSTPGVTRMHPIEFEGLLIELAVDNTTIAPDDSEFAKLVNELEFEETIEPEVISVEGKPYACPRCGATGDDRCVTASGKKTDRHAGRDIL